MEQTCILCEGKGWRVVNFRQKEVCFYCSGKGKRHHNEQEMSVAEYLCERGEHVMDASRGVCCFCGPRTYEMRNVG